MNRSFPAVFLLLFLITGIPFSAILWLMLGLTAEQAVIVGADAGIIIGLPLAYFLRAKQATIARDTDDLTNYNLHISAILGEYGYRFDKRIDRTVSYRPTMSAGLLADSVDVTVDPAEITIRGPKRHVDKLMSRLRQAPQTRS